MFVRCMLLCMRRFSKNCLVSPVLLYFKSFTSCFDISKVVDLTDANTFENVR